VIRTFETDYELVTFLEDYGIEMEDAYSIIDRFDSPVPASVQNASIFHEEESLHLHLHEMALHLLLDEADPEDEHKWTVTVRK
jgi:hypothetical protein